MWGSRGCQPHPRLPAKIMNTYWWIGLQEKKVIKNSQHMFTKGKSYPNSLMAYCEQLIVSADKGRVAAVVFLCFRKAFNMVSHSILVGKLQRDGLDG